MGRIVANIFLTLDGVMQDPGGPEQAVHDDSELGGWSTRYQDPVLGEAMGKGMADGGVMLLGRKTYEHLASYWPHQPDDNPYAAVLNNRQKYVVSRTLRDPLPWKNSTLIDGDVPEAVTKLREQHDKDVVVLGSGELIRSLLAVRPHRCVRPADPSRGAREGTAPLHRRRRVRGAPVGRQRHDDHRSHHRDLSARVAPHVMTFIRCAARWTGP
jgi:dihydrofolate reductase